MMLKYAIVLTAALGLSGCVAAAPAALITGIGGAAAGTIISDILLATQAADDAIAFACAEYKVRTTKSFSRRTERQAAIDSIRTYLDVACSHGVPHGTVQTAVWIALNVGDIIRLADA